MYKHLFRSYYYITPKLNAVWPILFYINHYNLIENRNIEYNKIYGGKELLCHIPHSLIIRELKHYINKLL